MSIYKYNKTSGQLESLTRDGTKQNKTLDPPITINGQQITTVEDALNALNTMAYDNQRTKANMVDSQTSVDNHVAILNSRGDLKDSGIDISTIGDVSGKADKVTNATNNNLAALDANGNLKDSGSKVSDFVTANSLGTAASKDAPASGNASSTEVVLGSDTRLTDSRTPTAHNQAAGTISAGTLGGQVLANASAVTNLANKQVRNIYAGTADMTAGSSALPTGDIYIVYTA